jgi:hypothetical protein
VSKTLRAAAAAALLVAVSAVTGCVHAQGCPSWAGYATPEEALEAADAVAVGDVGDVVATRQLFGATGNVWSFDVENWRKGTGPDRIEVLSPPSACGQTDDPYLGIDPFETAVANTASVVFLTDRNGVWMAISPVQGIVEMPADGELPAAWS